MRKVLARPELADSVSIQKHFTAIYTNGGFLKTATRTPDPYA
jgi:hypothetical protein